MDKILQETAKRFDGKRMPKSVEEYLSKQREGKFVHWTTYYFNCFKSCRIRNNPALKREF